MLYSQGNSLLQAKWIPGLLNADRRTGSLDSFQGPHREIEPGTSRLVVQCLMKLPIRNFLNSPITSFLLGPIAFLRTPVLVLLPAVLVTLLLLAVQTAKAVALRVDFSALWLKHTALVSSLSLSLSLSVLPGLIGAPVPKMRRFQDVFWPDSQWSYTGEPK